MNVWKARYSRWDALPQEAKGSSIGSVRLPVVTDSYTKDDEENRNYYLSVTAYTT